MTIPVQKLFFRENRMEIDRIFAKNVEQGFSNRIHLDMHRFMILPHVFPRSHISPNLRATKTDHGLDCFTVGTIALVVKVGN